MKTLKKLFLWFLRNDLFEQKPIDVANMNKWLELSWKDGGFKNYYTMRKKYLVNKLALGIEGKDMYETLGRLKELQQLSTNVNAAHLERMKALDKKIIVREKN